MELKPLLPVLPEPDWLEGIEEEAEAAVGTRSWSAWWQTRCDRCARFVSEGGPGVSWSQQWSYDYDGTPDLHDPTFRCSPCTDKHGIEPTNCNESRSKYHGRNPIAAAIRQSPDPLDSQVEGER